MLLKVEKLAKYFYIKEHFYEKSKKITAFKDISFSLKLGDKLNLQGLNGSGKTTLVKTIAMLNDFDDGDIIFQSQSLKGLDFEQKRKLRDEIILVMQNQKSALNPYKNIKWHFDMIEKNYQKTFDINMLEKFYLAKNILNRYPHELSGGQAQAVGFLRAMMVCPKLLIVDEVDAGLDKLVLDRYIKTLQEYENSVILISHDSDISKQICNQTYNMSG